MLIIKLLYPALKVLFLMRQAYALPLPESQMSVFRCQEKLTISKLVLLKPDTRHLQHLSLKKRGKGVSRIL